MMLLFKKKLNTHSPIKEPKRWRFGIIIVDYRFLNPFQISKPFNNTIERELLTIVQGTRSNGMINPIGEENSIGPKAFKFSARQRGIKL